MTETSKLKARQLSTKDYLLRPIAISDVGGKYLEWLNDEEVIRYLHVYLTDRSPEAVKCYVENVIADQNRYFYIISDQKKSMDIGTISCREIPSHGLGEYGYIIGDRRYWGSNAALQAQVCILDFAFETLGIRKMQASVYIANIPSQFNVKRLGFTKEGLFREDWLIGPDGREVSDVLRYGLLAREWAELSGKFDGLRRQNAS